MGLAEAGQPKQAWAVGWKRAQAVGKPQSPGADLWQVWGADWLLVRVAGMKQGWVGYTLG